MIYCPNLHIPLLLSHFLLLSSFAYGFSLTGKKSVSTSRLFVMKPASGDSIETFIGSNPLTGRRQAIFVSLAGLTGVGVTVAQRQEEFMNKAPDDLRLAISSKTIDLEDNKISESDILKTGTPTSTRRLASVKDAIDIISSSCDRRFLHAVVASDYNLMYRGISPEEAKYPSIRVNEASDLLVPSTYDSVEASEFFISLDEKMKTQPVRPSNGHLAVTNIDEAKLWGGEAASIWPLGENVHFAWLESGGPFWPQATAQKDDNLKVIVDGIDCGRMALEDALEGKNFEILFRADQYLMVPVSLEAELLSSLKTAYLI